MSNIFKTNHTLNDAKKNKKDIKINTKISDLYFPELFNKKEAQLMSDDNRNYLETLIKKNESSDKENDDNDVLPGWVVIQYDKKSNGIIKKYNEEFRNERMVMDKEEEEQKRINQMMNQLADHYERYKRNYIDLWGEDEYQKMYISKYYDPHYFDKLDELEYKEGEHYYNENENENSLYDEDNEN